jgi:uncharacterized membrane protein
VPKILSLIEAVFSGVRNFAKTSPALAAGLVSIGVALLARFGFHVNANTLAALVSAVTAFLAGLVHVSTSPSGKHESEVREQHS